MISRHRSIAIVLPLAVAAAPLVLYLRGEKARPDAGITVVDSTGRPLAAPPAVRSDATHVTVPVPIEPMIDEAPPALKSLHIGVQRDRDATSAVNERRVTDLFAGDAALGASDVTVRCSRDRCEVHGVAAGDETMARMAMGGDAFLDRLLAAGYSAGMNMVSGRAQGGSEFVVYLEPR